MNALTLIRRPLPLLLIAAVAASVTTTACAAPAPAVPGNAADFSVNYFTVPNVAGSWLQRWNPCAPVHYRVDVQQVPTALANVKASVAQLSTATGITFVYDGAANFIPTGNNWNKQSPSLVISFAKHAGVAGGSSYLHEKNQLGEGGFQSSYVTSNGKVASYKIVKGYVVIDTDGYKRSTPKVRTAVVLHELGHAVGLNHARFATELMYPLISNAGQGTYTAGDRSGLRAVGRTAGCLS